ncbi:MAG: type II toxin-antitoxin system prevent-host-death family antitoxin [Acidobacteriaceae bacterium]|nr:type II toxin-antitoxin system prevent-host-death family antitoxin [Acidobacteriaceae bacterium]MBV9779559.1 type II toxin-antitoxin system prevent-host-death family antitoxin [Acidobacteriaceae bacterium]
MREYTASEARERFAEVLQAVEQGNDVAITKHGKPVARITRVEHAQIPARGWATKEGWSVTMSDDFNAVPEEFEDYT